MHPILLIVFLPLLAALVAGLTNKAAPSVFAKAITTGALFVSAALSWPIFLGFVAGTYEPTVVPVLKWVQSGSLAFDWALRVDTLTAIMLVVINTVSALVHLYSWGYMDEDPDQPRFFAYLSLFTFAMLMLVTADNLVQMFFGWEGVGLASYLLIGFWFRKPSASAAAIKAFVVNRVGDLGFMLGIFGTYLVFDTVSITEILAAAPGMSGATIGFLGYNVYTMDVLCVLLFIGAMGKSAQLGLHTWLPDAMEGPTPVSALIHAATMVTAGVFMVCRLSPMFETAPVALGLVTFIGAATCIFAATVGTTQWDIKRVIAYSTCSQLGYMFFAAGVGAYGAAMFHLFTHAFFKALLFLGAGSVIHAMHHEQDMRYYGELRKHIPLTFWAMMAGTLAITGVGIYHLGAGFAGFWSKDAILEVAYGRGTELGNFAFWMGTFAALLTSFYSWRLMFLTFWGKPRWIESEHIQHSVHKTPEEAGADTTGGYHPHESPLTMLIPLGVLSIGAVLAGQVFAPTFLDDAAFWGSSIFYNEPLIHAMHNVPYLVKYAALIVMVIGLVVAWYAYIKDTSIPAKTAEQLGPIYRFLYNKWYFDELYHYLFVVPAFWLGRQFWKIGDVGTIDRFGPNGIAWVVEKGSVGARKFQTGYLYSYALVMLLGLVAAITWVLF
ncbi:MAG: NADH-quinone oxidoreductase subunit L [Pseudomonadota bacterium]|uniref:NADH-ubiquinone oxidoreductase chain 5 n=1 Tax=Qipengyuania flava TaxID=192812 RepID=A0A5P6NF41_9SPHN|nr:NADH-quinone oxidoreductase subunit L [Qipengyuania flava]MEC8714578.1 NADH-quinone oxidoreductase subunit L [Pseudomonadota bacterium]MBO9504854.1 NADH-quinone oxidoreductase subunit L [Qipengyuania flava]MBW3168477.1 NADH-quinone oxidoreductase subunit L [Qipengyuania flava]MBY5965715.1 NADH-quinone oxidoreductase subunit L [Qipengyuania flava]MBY6012039.1 NADH-quinone oxidoreductase subunit L [Qipengyuania flava]